MGQFNFTKASIDALPLPKEGQRSTYRDAKTNGLQLRITQNGIKTFSVFRRIKGGQPERITLGRYPDISIEQARRKAAEINAVIAGGANPAETKRELQKEPTFGELFQDYLERHAKVHKRSWTNDEINNTKYVEKSLSSKKLSDITRQTVAMIHSRITKQGAPIAANRVLALISSVLGRAREWGLIDINPAMGIRRNPEHSRDRFLQSDELPRFFDALAQEQNPLIRDYFLISLLTGARRANVQSMRWMDLNLEEGIWRIPQTKNNTPQNITLTAEALTVLQARKDAAKSDAVYVFPGVGVTGHLVEPKTGWYRVLERADLADLRIHDLRRTLGSWQAKTGASLAIIGKSLNHKTHQATAIYARLDLDPVRESVERATAAMLAAGGLKQPTKVVRLVKRKRGKPENV